MADLTGEDFRKSRMMETIKRETAHLKAQPSYKAGSGILITGVTGATGSYILRALLLAPNTPKIYCLVRVSDGRDRLLKLFPDCDGLKDESKVIFINGDITDPFLGIPEYESVKRSISTIIHTAWLVNYNSNLKDFQPHITGLRYLLNMLAGNEAAHFLFISSMSSVFNLSVSEPLPEAFVSKPEAALPGGYGESKFVAESILNHAALEQKIGVSVFRWGQIAPALSTNVPWKQDEWIPILFKTSKAIGSLPVDFGFVAWIPVDVVATIVYEVYLQRPEKPRYLNVINHDIVTFVDLAPTIQRALGNEVMLTTRAEWVEKLAKFDRKDRNVVKAMPALKILWFYENFPAAEPMVHLNQLKELSPTFRNLKAIRPEWVAKWLKDLRHFTHGDLSKLKAKLA